MAFGQIGLLPTRQFLAGRGNYFTARNATPGTGIALAAQIQAFAATNGFFVLNNTSPTLSVYLDYLKLILTAATTAVVSVDFLFVADTVTRNPSTAANGTALVPVSNSGRATQSALAIQAFNAAGAMTIPAAGAASFSVSRVHFATGLHVVGDLLKIQFGDLVQQGPGGLTGATRTTASSPGSFVAESAPVVIPPLGWLVCHRWSLTEAGAPSYEYELAWLEG